MFEFGLKAASTGAAFLFGLIFVFSAYGAPSARAKLAIKNAEDLSLQKERVKASQTLQEALLKEPANSKHRKALLESLDQLTTLFYTESAQKTYSLAHSMLYANPNLAIDRLQEALKAEPGNLTVLLTLARAQIFSGSCQDALSTLEEAKAMNPLSTEVQTLRLKALACQDKLSEMEEIITQEKLVLSSDITAKLLKAQLLISTQPDAAKEQLKQMEAQEPNFPETYYWLWSLLKESDQAEVYAEKYVSLCRTVSPQMRRQFLNEPRLCLKLDELEEYIRKSGQANGDGAG